MNTADFCSEKVEIIFSALRSTIIEMGDKAFELQERDVTDHIIQIVRCLPLKSFTTDPD